MLTAMAEGPGFTRMNADWKERRNDTEAPEARTASTCVDAMTEGRSGL